MKILLTLSFILSLTATGWSQDFSKNIATAKNSYAGGNLEDARFAMEQMLNDIDMVIGKEVLKMLPAKLENFTSNPKNDNVAANTGLSGVAIHRDYGTGEKILNLDLMSNSPVVASINAILSIPFMGNSGDGTQKIIKVEGYKAILQKSVDAESSKTNYTLQIPIGATLLTFTAPDTDEEDVIRMANSIPLSQITKLVE